MHNKLTTTLLTIVLMITSNGIIDTVSNGNITTGVLTIISLIL